MKARTSVLGLILVPLAAAAQPAAGESRRGVVFTGAADERPAMVYGASDVALELLFDAPLRPGDAGFLALPGADVRPHPFLSNALILTPSSALAERTSVPLRVALADGGSP